MTGRDDILAKTWCGRCEHTALMHEAVGKHACMVDTCPCAYFGMPVMNTPGEPTYVFNQYVNAPDDVTDIAAEIYRNTANKLGLLATLDPKENLEAPSVTRSGVPVDAINPSHYRDGEIEVWDFIVDKKLDYCLGAAVKYISRAGKKGGPEKELEDLKKARNYIDRKIREVEERDS